MDYKDYLSKLQNDYKYFKDMLKSLEKRKENAWERFCKNEV